MKKWIIATLLIASAAAQQTHNQYECRMRLAPEIDVAKQMESWFKL